MWHSVSYSMTIHTAIGQAGALNRISRSRNPEELLASETRHPKSIVLASPFIHAIGTLPLMQAISGTAVAIRYRAIQIASTHS